MARAADKTLGARELAIEAARLANDRNCDDVLVLDLREISPATDYFVIATGTSDRQLKAVAEEIVQSAKSMGHRPYHVAGRESAVWLLVDFVDVVVHLFDQQHRSYYDLELIWGEAPRVDWERPTAKP
jgi:ribosome-associated protein